MIVKPHGGTLINRILSEKEREAILSYRDKFFNLEIDEEKPSRSRTSPPEFFLHCRDS